RMRAGSTSEVEPAIKLIGRYALCSSQAFRDFDLGAPRIRDVDDTETRGVRAVPDRSIRLDPRGLKLRHERVDVFHFKTHVVHRAPFRRHLRLVGFSKGDLGAGNIRRIELRAFACSRAEVVDVPLLSR